jgi:predicted nucleotidyltransferase
METLPEIDISKNELIQILKNLDILEFSKFEIDFIYLGGSFANGTNGWWSDLDIFLSIPNYRFKTSEAKLKILLKLTNFFEEQTHFENIQLSVIENLPLHVQFSIIKYGIVIFESNLEKRLKFIERLLNNYYDHQIWYTRIVDESLGLIKDGN